MELFKLIEDGYVVLRSRGVYRQAKLYRRGEDIYAAHSGGYVKLHGYAGTSAPNIGWADLHGKHVTTVNSAPVWKGEEKAAEPVANGKHPNDTAVAKPTPITNGKARPAASATNAAPCAPGADLA